MTALDALFATVLLLSSLLAALLFWRSPEDARPYGLTTALLFALFAFAHITHQISAASVLLVTSSAALAFTVFRDLAKRPRLAVLAAALGVGALAASAGDHFGYPSIALSLTAASAIALLVLGPLHLRAKRRAALLIGASGVALGA